MTITINKMFEEKQDDKQCVGNIKNQWPCYISMIYERVCFLTLRSQN